MNTRGRFLLAMKKNFITQCGKFLWIASQYLSWSLHEECSCGLPWCLPGRRMLYWGLKFVCGETNLLQVHFLQNNSLYWIDTRIHVLFSETNNVLNICFLYWWIYFYWYFLSISSCTNQNFVQRKLVMLKPGHESRFILDMVITSPVNTTLTILNIFIPCSIDIRYWVGTMIFVAQFWGLLNEWRGSKSFHFYPRGWWPFQMPLIVIY